VLVARSRRLTCEVTTPGFKGESRSEQVAFWLLTLSSRFSAGGAQLLAAP
jgi:hypothetical protein